MKYANLTMALVSKVVSDPEAVKATEEPLEDGDGTIVYLHVAKEDMGRVIGRDGRTIDAFRTLLRAATHQDGQRIILKLMEDDEDINELDQIES